MKWLSLRTAAIFSYFAIVGAGLTWALWILTTATAQRSATTCPEIREWTDAYFACYAKRGCNLSVDDIKQFQTMFVWYVKNCEDKPQAKLEKL